MKIKIEFECNNAAFTDDFDGEITRIFRTLRRKVMAQLQRMECICDAPEADDKIMDINGNTVGRIQVLR